VRTTLNSRAESPGRRETLLDVHGDAVEEIAFPPCSAARRPRCGAAREPSTTSVWRYARPGCNPQVPARGGLPPPRPALRRWITFTISSPAPWPGFRRHASMSAREALGRRWMTSMAASMADNTRHDPFRKKRASQNGPWCHLLAPDGTHMPAAALMGMQSTAVRRLGRISTTYLTSTLTRHSHRAGHPPLAARMAADHRDPRSRRDRSGARRSRRRVFPAVGSCCRPHPDRSSPGRLTP
jgi:hypothetical protein